MRCRPAHYCRKTVLFLGDLWADQVIVQVKVWPLSSPSKVLADVA